MTEKRMCYHCEDMLPLTDFSTGHNFCKVCRNKKYRERMKKRREETPRYTDDGVSVEKFHNINSDAIYCY